LLVFALCNDQLVSWAESKKSHQPPFGQPGFLGHARRVGGIQRVTHLLRAQSWVKLHYTVWGESEFIAPRNDVGSTTRVLHLSLYHTIVTIPVL